MVTSAEASPSWQPTTASVLIELLTCPLCSRPLDAARSLPCGNSLCDTCWDAASIDGEMKRCPFSCAKGRHWSGTSHDVTLTKIWEIIYRTSRASGLFGGTKDSSSHENLFRELVASAVQGGVVRRIDNTSHVEADEDVDVASLPKDDNVPSDTESVPSILLPNILSELDCQICYCALHDPLTTPCGHTFCRSCLLRSVDHSPTCPTCRAALPPPFANMFHAPKSIIITLLFQHFWPLLWDERKKAIQEDNATAQELFGTMDSRRLGPGITLPIFVCTLAFPYMPTFLHIFEPRYKLMIRRCLESDSRFGICLPKPSDSGSSVGEDPDCPTSQFGTILRIYNVQYLEDGRSLVETHGEDRFRLERWGIRDGYMVGHVELLPDDGTDGDSEDSQASSLMSATDLQLSLTDDDEDRSIDELLKEASDFIANLRNGSAPWILQSVELTHGEVPDDPTVFVFWVASLIPVDEQEKYLLLKARGVKTRLRIVLHWIRKMQTQWWFNGGCAVM